MNEDNVTGLTVEILQDIRDQLRAQSERTEHGFGEMRNGFAAVRVDFAAVHAEIAGLRADMATLEDEAIEGFTGVRYEIDRVNRRLDHFIETSSRRFERLERRRPRRPR